MAENVETKSRGWLIGVLLVVVAAAVVFYVRSSGRDTVDVRTATVSHADLTSTVSTNGKVEPVEDFQAHAPGPSVIDRVFVHLGDHVAAGAELLRMDASDARKNVATAQAGLQSAEAALANLKSNGTTDENLSAKADLATAKVQVQQASATLASTQALQARGSASANEVQSAKQRLEDAQARVSQLETRGKGRYSVGDISAQQAQVAQARASLAAAQKAYASIDIHAPFAGTVYSLPVGDFDFVNNGEALLNMADLNHIQVRAYFDEPEIGKLAAGQPVKIVWDAKPNTSWHGHIHQAPTTIITYGTRNVGECLITVDGAKGDLLPNTNVTVTVTTSQKVGALSIPREALHSEASKNFVFRVVNGRLQNVPVQVGSVNQTRAEIVSGLSDGDVVAVSSPTNLDLLKDGLQVKAIN